MTSTYQSFLRLIFSKSKVFLILAILTFSLAFFMYFFTEKGPISATEDKYLYDVQIKAQEEVKVCSEDAKRIYAVIQQLPANPQFSHFSLTTQHPYFVFKNQQLVYWSDDRFVPDYAMIRGNYAIKSLDLSGSKFLINHFIERGFEVFSLIELYHLYESETNHLKSNYNPAIFSIDPQRLDISRAPATHLNVFSEEQAFLFSVVPPKVDNLKNQSIPVNVILLGILGLFFLTVFILACIWNYNHKHKFEKAFILLAVYLLTIRGVMLFYSLPFIFYESHLFNPKYYASSAIIPSLGDLILNSIAFFILLLYLVNYYYKMKFYFWMMHLSETSKKVLAGVLIVWSFYVFNILYHVLVNIYTHSQYRLDLSLSIDFWERPLKVSCIEVFILVSIIYFLSIHLLSNLFIKLLRRAKLLFVVGLIVVVGLAVMAFYVFTEQMSVFVLSLHWVYFLLVYLLRFPKYLYTFRYQTSIYFFTVSIICAALATFVIYNQAIRRDTVQKQQFGKKYLAENDEIGEFLLSKINTQVRTDSTLQSLTRSAVLPREQIQNYIKKYLLDSYFDYYDVEISVFDLQGNSLDNSSGALNYNDYIARYGSPKYRTNYTGLYFVNEPHNGFLKQYVEFIPVATTSESQVGFVILDLRERDGITRDGVAEFALSGESQPEVSNFSYAVYENNRIVNIGGKDYNYERKMPKDILENPALYTEGVTYSGYKHLAINGKNHRKIIVSSEVLSPSTIYSNFSFLFLILVVTIICVMLMYSTRYGFMKMNVNLATKIQIYLNIAFLLPLILVVGITLSIIGTKLGESQAQAYLSQTENASISIWPAVEKYVQGKMSKPFLSDTLIKIAANSKKYVSVFDTTGRLLATNKQLPYETGMVSPFLNPKAYIKLIEEKERKVSLTDQLGNLSFMSAFVGIRSNDGRLLGVVSVPFYDSKVLYEKEVIAVIGSLLNTFTTIFLVLLLLSYFASNALTVPLRMITNKLKKIDLNKPNEPLSWRSDDEIGVLIKAYNEMLVKLEESKMALADSNKQSAWQQMAKQVAHEIKNPLTPMKLSLQLLQHKLSRGAVIDTVQIKDQIESLTGQIDNLSYIANSFSDFARMPIPKKEVFDFVSEATKVINLFLEDKKIKLIKDIPNSSIYVVGDRHLTGNIIKNLIVNAIQSVPPYRHPTILIKLTVGIEAITFSVTDNGIGIPEDDRSKIFMLDFSTKEEGSGVGLALAKWVVDNAKGSIWFETSNNGGSTFYFTLPLG